ncbi:MAG: hypothetical protein ABSG86_09030 [Thermoguttaceae bacterium]|jgi:hypothetical protein
MVVVTKKYVEDLPDIYRDILTAFPEIEPARKAGEGLAYQTLYGRLQNWPEGEGLYDYVQAHRRRSWSLGEVVQACQNMERGGAVVIKHDIFVHPTPLGEEMIAILTGKKAGQHNVPDFPTPAQG